MIKQIEIKNFKCYGERMQVLNFSKINFIFGDNSTGKSTFLQALDLICADYQVIDKDFKTFVFKGDEKRTLEILARLGSKNPENDMVLELQKKGNGQPTEISLSQPMGPEGVSRISPHLFRQALGSRFHHIKAPRPSTIAAAQSSLASNSFANAIMSTPSIRYCNQAMEQLRLSYERRDRNSLFDTTLNVKVSLENVGAGIDNLIHLCDELYEWSQGEEAGGIMVVEEPESHVNERQLGALTKFLVSTALETKDGQLFVECHSELMALELRNLLKHKMITPEDLSIAVIARTPDGSEVTEIKTDCYGNFRTRWPDGGFFTERVRIIDGYFN